MQKHRLSLLRRLAVGAFALGLGAFLGGPAQAEVAVGAEAPDVEAADYFNIEPTKLSELKGRVVLLELWKTT